MPKSATSRRRFLQIGSAVATGLLLPNSVVHGFPAILKHYKKPDSVIKGVQIGTITYSFRSMPDQSAEATLQYILDSGISAVELMGDPAETFAGRPENTVDRSRMWGLMRKRRNGEELTAEENEELAEIRKESEAFEKAVAKWRAGASLDDFRKLRKMYGDAGVSIYGYKPSTFGKGNSDEEITFGMQAGKALGASHVTVEHPGNDEMTLRLGTLAKKNKMRIAYHGHEQQHPTFWETALDQTKGNAINLDIGHYVAAGNEDPLGFVRDHHKDIMSMHLKDRRTPENGKDNVIWGQGDTPIGRVLNQMSVGKYKFPATVELEYDIPEDSDAVKEVARCLEFCREQLT